LRNKYNIDTNILLICKEKRIHWKGWLLYKNKDYRLSNKGRVYIFHHPDHGKFICNQKDIVRKYALNQSNVALMCSNKQKSHKGWKLLT